jgi:hypothetical protein
MIFVAAERLQQIFVIYQTAMCPPCSFTVRTVCQECDLFTIFYASLSAAVVPINGCGSDRLISGCYATVWHPTVDY